MLGLEKFQNKVNMELRRGDIIWGIWPFLPLYIYRIEIIMLSPPSFFIIKCTEVTLHSTPFSNFRTINIFLSLIYTGLQLIMFF